MMDTVNLNAPLKVFVSDLTRFTKSDLSWIHNFHGSNVKGNISKIHIQGEICKTAGFNNEILIVDDGTGKAKVVKGSQVPGDLSWISSGVYCSVVGSLLENGKLPQILAHKIARINNKILQEMWSLEVKELQALIVNKVFPKLPDHSQVQE